ncbi:MAG TPA: PEGA domain-containing protein [Gemmatimonadales bacterium]|jgi:hypothetical protein
MMRVALIVMAAVGGGVSWAAAQDYAPPEWTIRLSTQLEVQGQPVLVRALHSNRAVGPRADWVQLRVGDVGSHFSLLITPVTALELHELLWLQVHGVVVAADEIVATTLTARVHVDKRRTLTFVCELDCGDETPKVVMLELSDPEADRLNVTLQAMASELGVRREVAAAPVAAATVVAPDVSEGRLTIDAQPRATLRIDGEPIGETPIADLQVAIREHELLLEREGYESVTDVVTVRPTGTLRRSYVLQKTAAQTILDRGGGLLMVTSRPYASVYVDDDLVGETPLRDVALTSGVHILRVERAGFLPVTDTILILGGTTLRRTYELQEGGPPPMPEPGPRPAATAPPAPSPTAAEVGGDDARVTITSTPVASVWVDGRHVGETPIVGFRLSSGTHILELVKDGYRSVSDTLDVEPGVRLRKSYRLEGKR